MSFGTAILKIINPLFPKRIHPFNLANEGVETYAEWQYEKGRKTIQFYLERYTPEEMFQNKRVLDLGCGAAGKSLYYASLGAKEVIGVDMVERYKAEAEALAAKLGFEERFRFLLADAARLPLENGTVDTVIMNDFMEHVADPPAVLAEAFRLLKPGGRIYINFPPYRHPFGAHLSDAINVPWVHLFFREKTMIAVYKELIADLPDARERINLRFSENEKGEPTISYINKMSIKRFKAILKEANIKPIYWRETPLRPALRIPAKILPEFFVGMVTCILGK